MTSMPGKGRNWWARGTKCLLNTVTGSGQVPGVVTEGNTGSGTDGNTLSMFAPLLLLCLLAVAGTQGERIQHATAVRHHCSRPDPRAHFAARPTCFSAASAGGTHWGSKCSGAARYGNGQSRRMLSLFSLRGGAANEGAGNEGGGVGALKVMRLSPAAKIPGPSTATLVNVHGS